MSASDRLQRLCVAAAVLLGASCAAPPGVPEREPLAAQAAAALARSGAGADALKLIDNMLRHEPGPPRAAPPLVRALLGEPLRAADVRTLFERAVPRELLAFAPAAQGAAAATLDELIATYVSELAGAQAMLRQAAARASIDEAALVGEPEVDFVEALRAAVDLDSPLLAQANGRFVRATAAFVAGLRRLPAAGFPQGGRRFDSAVGSISIGSHGNDRHGPGHALIVDPGGNDAYERAPLSGAGVSVIVDLGGNDTYAGSDLAVHGFSALVDFSGDDRYRMSGAGLGAAIAGAALLIDFAGDDRYEAGRFAQGAAAYGLGALVDFAGEDRYAVQAWGQGFGMADGVGLLWDRAGNDRYGAMGRADPYARGGSVSFAQGAAFGLRTTLGGGVGILRDDSGDDAYEAEMFAQGTGYYYGLGMLWDRSGDDEYRAVRYGQGNGVHEAVGVLRDESGTDRYALRIGVGQGMGLDLAVGLLYDDAGDDRYQAGVHAQGNATGNGIGVLFDAGGADQWHLGADPRGWGRAEPSRGLPSFGLLLHEPARASFWREGSAVAPPRDGTPLPVVEGERYCPAVPVAPAQATAPFAEAVRSLEPVFRAAPGNAATFAYVRQRLTKDLPAALAELPGDDFTIAWLLGSALPCMLRQASAEEAAGMWRAMEAALAAAPASPFAFAMAAALRERPAPPEQLQRIVDALERHPSCAVRAAALRLRGSAAAARAALGASCWRLQAAALELLGRLGMDAPRDVALPSFLRASPGDH